MRAWPARSFLDHSFPQAPWLVKHLLPGQGWAILIAPGKTGKSVLAQQIARGLSHGQSFLYWHVDGPKRVLLVEADAPEVDLQEQMRAIDPDPSPLLHVAVPEHILLTTPTEALALWETVGKLQPDLVIFDALETLTTHDINTKDGAQRAVEGLKKICRGAPFLLIHHPRKERPDAETQEDMRNATAGSHYLTTNPSVLMRLTANATHGHLDVLPRRGRERSYKLVRQELSEDVAIWKIPDPEKPRLVPTGASIAWPDNS